MKHIVEKTSMITKLGTVASTKIGRKLETHQQKDDIFISKKSIQIATRMALKLGVDEGSLECTLLTGAFATVLSNTNLDAHPSELLKASTFYKRALLGVLGKIARYYTRIHKPPTEVNPRNTNPK